MSTVVSDPRITDFRVTEDTITARLADGRTISVPLAWVLAIIERHTGREEPL